MVFDVPAESGGALSILNDFYNEVTSHEDKGVNWIFVVSKPQLKATEYIKVLRFPWIKKSWWHRLYFDNYVAPKLIKNYMVDKVLSFQNLVIPKTNVSQTLYVHQPLPFISYRFGLRENKRFWIYQNIIGKNIMKSIQRADKVIVQTEWMKKACIEKTGIEIEKIEIVPPQINLDIEQLFKANEESYSTFFFPASELTYKNHEVVVRACKKLKESGIIDFRVIFTLKGNENDHIIKLYNEVNSNQLPIEFVGDLTREQVFDLYTKSVLLFPSYIETFGLPLLEARLHGGIIIASDCPFSREILVEYENSYFFNPFDVNELFILMKSTIQSSVKYFPIPALKKLCHNGSGKLIEKILKNF